MFNWYSQSSKPKFALSNNVFQWSWLILGGAVNLAVVYVIISSFSDNQALNGFYSLVYLILFLVHGYFTYSKKAITVGAYWLFGSIFSYVFVWLSASSYYPNLAWLFVIYLIWLIYSATLQLIIGYKTE